MGWEFRQSLAPGSSASGSLRGLQSQCQSRDSHRGYNEGGNAGCSQLNLQPMQDPLAHLLFADVIRIFTNYSIEGLTSMQAVCRRLPRSPSPSEQAHGNIQGERIPGRQEPVFCNPLMEMTFYRFFCNLSVRGMS